MANGHGCHDAGGDQRPWAWNVKIFVPGLTSNINQPALCKLANSLLKRPWYRFSANRVEITDCSIFRMTDLDTQQVEIAAILDVSITRQAWELLEKLNGYRLDGRTLHAHKWFPRTQPAERRAQYNELLGMEPMPVPNDRRHQGERRRNLKIDNPHRAEYQIDRDTVRSFKKADQATGQPAS